MGSAAAELRSKGVLSQLFRDKVSGSAPRRGNSPAIMRILGSSSVSPPVSVLADSAGKGHPGTDVDDDRFDLAQVVGARAADGDAALRLRVHDAPGAPSSIEGRAGLDSRRSATYSRRPP